MIKEFGLKMIKVFGLKRSGTNYLELLLEKNFGVKTFYPADKGGFKHGEYKPQLLEDNVKCIVISKNIHSWLVSYYKRLREIDREREYFGLSRDMGFNEYLISGVVGVWNRLHKSWIEAEKKHEFIFVKYEDLVYNPGIVLENISDIFGLSYNFVGDIDKVVKSGQRVMDKDFDSSYYLDKKYMNLYEDRDKRFVENNVDRYVVRKLGY